MRALVLLLAAALAAPAVVAQQTRNWHTIALLRDQTHIKNWRTTWMQALAEARAAGFATAIAGEGALLQPDAALEQPEPPDGPYRCRTLKLGRPLVPTPDPSPLFRTMATAHCRVTGATLAQIDGMQRPSGTLYVDNGMRRIFLGALALGDEPGTGRYGRDPQRSLAGFLERIGPTRWRLVIPQPWWEAKLVVVDLVPDGG